MNDLLVLHRPTQVMPGIFGVMTLFNPYQAFSDPLPLGYDAAGDLLVGRESPRVALAVLLGAVSES